jgi:hypothetical protein
MGEMTSVERIQAAIALQPVDRVPITPKIDTSYAARSHGVKIAEVVRNADRGRDVLVQTFDDLGGFDAAPNAGMNDIGFGMMGMITKLPGYHLGEDDLWQLDEQDIMQPEDYDFIVQNGWNAYLGMAYARVWERGHMPVPPDQFMGRLIEMGDRGIADMQFWEAKGVPTSTGMGAFVPFESFRFSRSLKELIADLYRHPEKVMAASEAYMEEQVPMGIGMFQAVKGATKWGYLGSFMGQASATMLSPRFFNKFFWPYEKRIVNSLLEAGITPWLHSDSNWTSFLEYFLELPKGKVVLDIDSLTDIFKAKQILKGHMCIAGDVPPALLKLGTTDEVIAYTKKLIDLVGEDGGFILSSGCSVPVDANPENVKAMVDTGKNYYPHHKVFAGAAVS